MSSTKSKNRRKLLSFLLGCLLVLAPGFVCYSSPEISLPATALESSGYTRLTSSAEILEFLDELARLIHHSSASSCWDSRRVADQSRPCCSQSSLPSSWVSSIIKTECFLGVVAESLRNSSKRRSLSAVADQGYSVKKRLRLLWFLTSTTNAPLIA